MHGINQIADNSAVTMSMFPQYGELWSASAEPIMVLIGAAWLVCIECAIQCMVL